jgi:hypothetical protein
VPELAYQGSERSFEKSALVPTFAEIVPADVIENIKWAWLREPAFRADFAADPKRAYRDRFGAELLPSHNVKMVQAEERMVISVRGCDEIVLCPSEAYAELFLKGERADAGFEIAPAAGYAGGD